MKDTNSAEMPNLPRRAARIDGIDMARGIAIIGMLLVHVGPTDQYGFPGQLYAFPFGRASLLFVMLAGLGVTMLLASNRKSQKMARLKLVWNLLFLLVLGLSLQELGHGRWVILQHFSLLFLSGLGLANLSNRGLLMVAAGSIVFGPLVYLAGQIYWPGWFNQAAVAWSNGPVAILHGLILSGPYPLITYLAPFAVGMWIGRLDLSARAIRLNLVFRGGSAALLAVALAIALQAAVVLPTASPGWDWLAITRPHSQMPLWMLGGIGSAVCVLGLSLFTADAMGRWCWPLVAFGQLALSIYVGHLLLFVWARPAFSSRQFDEAVMIVLAIVCVAAAFAVLWRRLFSRGPLELVMNSPWYLLERVRHRKRAGQGKVNTPA